MWVDLAKIDKQGAADTWGNPSRACVCVCVESRSCFCLGPCNEPSSSHCHTHRETPIQRIASEVSERVSRASVASSAHCSPHSSTLATAQPPDLSWSRAMHASARRGNAF